MRVIFFTVCQEICGRFDFLSLQHYIREKIKERAMLFSHKKKKEIKIPPLPFGQKDCHTIKTANLNAIPISHPPLYNFHQKIFIQKYYQTNINSGILEGIPRDLSPWFRDSQEIATNFFKSADIHFIPPALLEFNFPEERNPYFLLPNYLTLALIDKHLPLPGDTADNYASSIRVAWWQSSVGLPETQIVEALEHLVWTEPYAWSWSD